MAATIIKGNDLMLFIPDGTQGYKSVAYATAHTLTLSGETSDTSSKDHGVYGAQEVTKINWEITTENLYTDNSFDELFDAMIARKPIKLVWGSKVQIDPTKTVVDDDYRFWTPNSSTSTNAHAYCGNAYVTSLSANANNGENATFSATFTGAGKITRENPTPASPDPSNPTA